jgi:hypothetical protein
MEYGGKPCAFCKDGQTGTFYVSQDSVAGMYEEAEKYRRFIDTGGEPEDWDDGPPEGWEPPGEPEHLTPEIREMIRKLTPDQRVRFIEELKKEAGIE